ncbi:hypothetical protein GCM10018775_14590 [Streptomyces umbrinus]|nr:hypothetical protein GCM10018775_14590 [Streptomyces umbrinus]
MDDEEHEDDTEGYEDLGTVPEEAGVAGTPPPGLLMDDGDSHARMPPSMREPRLVNGGWGPVAGAAR